MHGILKDISKLLASLPGIGPRSARKIAITLALQKENTTHMLIEMLSQLKNKIRTCNVCNNLTEETLCYICNDHSRDHNQICIVAEISDLWAIESIKQYQGCYHILGGSLSIANGIAPETLNFESLEERLNENEAHKECIIAMDPTIQGQATVHYVHELLKKYDNVTISTLSLGLPMGSHLDYIDNSTLAMAMASRKEI